MVIVIMSAERGMLLVTTRQYVTDQIEDFLPGKPVE
jgi:hypothetical protein